MIRIADIHNKVIRPINKNLFFNILHHSFQILLQSLQKVPIKPPKNILEKSQIYIKNAKFYADFKSVKSIIQKSMQKKLC